jgi:hypothetical protein
VCVCVCVCVCVRARARVCVCVCARARVLWVYVGECVGGGGGGGQCMESNKQHNVRGIKHTWLLLQRFRRLECFGLLLWWLVACGEGEAEPPTTCCRLGLGFCRFLLLRYLGRRLGGVWQGRMHDGGGEIKLATVKEVAAVDVGDTLG